MYLGEMKVKVIKLVNSYSNNGVLISTTNGNYQDYVLRMVDLANDAQMEIAKFVKLPAVHSFTQYPVTNLLGMHAGFDMVQYTGTELTYAGTGAKSYYFEVDRPCTVYIEEEITGTWTNLKTINVTGITKFTGHRGVLTPSSATNSVRLRFTGDYPYVIRHRALFPYSYPTDNDVPTYKAFVPYSMPSDFMELERIMYWYDQRQYTAMPGDYRLSNNNRTLEINWFTTGQIDVHYYRYPTTLDATTEDSYEFEVEINAQSIIPYYVAAMIIMDENQNIGMLLLSQYQNKLGNLSNTYSPQNTGEILDTRGW